MTQASFESAEVVRFSKAARQYCSWAEASPSESGAELQRGLRLLSEVYAAALDLPEVSAALADTESGLSQQDWKSIFRRFGSLPIDAYSEVFDPSVVPGEPPVVGQIADDLADVYRDLVHGIRLLEHGRAEEAVATWQMNFRIHWGRHAVSALRVMHCLAETTHAW